MFEKIRRNLPRTQPNPTPSAVFTTKISNPRLLEVDVDTSTSPSTISGIFGIDIKNTGVLATRSLRITDAKIELLKNKQSLNIGKIEEIKQIKDIPSDTKRTVRIKFSRKNTFINKIDKDICDSKEIKANIDFTVAEIILAATYSSKKQIPVYTTDCNLITVDIEGQSNININQEYTWKLVASDGSTLDDVEWDMGDGTAKTGAEVTHEYTREGAFNITAQSGGNSDSLSVNAERLPLAIVGPTSVGVGESNTWEPSGNNLENLSGFSWSMGDGTVIQGEQAQHAYQSEEEYTLSVTTNEGTSTSITVESSFPNITLDSINGRDEVIVNNSYGWTVVGSNLGKADEIEWTMGDGSNIKSGQQIDHTYDSRSEYTIIASAKVKGQTIDSIELPVNVVSPSIILTSIDGGDQSMEDGIEYTFSVRGDNLQEADEIVWSMGDGTTKTGISISHTYNTSYRGDIAARARFEDETVDTVVKNIVVSDLAV